jgi:hypothetical protein
MQRSPGVRGEPAESPGDAAARQAELRGRPPEATGFRLFHTSAVDLPTGLAAELIVIPASAIPYYVLNSYYVSESEFRMDDKSPILNIFEAPRRTTVIRADPDVVLGLLSSSVAEAVEVERGDVARYSPNIQAFSARLLYDTPLPFEQSALKGQTLADLAKFSPVPFAVFGPISSPGGRVAIVLLTAVAIVVIPPLSTAGKVLSRWVDLRLSTVLGLPPDHPREPPRKASGAEASGPRTEPPRRA